MLATALALPGGATASILDVHHDSTVVTEAGGGDGIISPGDSLNVTEAIVNSDPLADITNVQGTLTTGTPDVTIPQASSAYPTLSFGATTPNSTPYGLQLGSNYECGRNIDLSLGLTATQGTGTVPFSIGTGMAAAPTDYTSADVPRGIPDFPSTATSSLAIIPSARVKQIAVHIGRLDHSWDGDLRLTLIAPDGTRVTLVDQRGEGGQNFNDTWITPDQGSPMAGATAPFTGTYVADGDLSQMVGRHMHGTWTLEIRDMAAGNTGTLVSWGLEIAEATCAAQPVASFTATPNPTLPGDTVQLDASGSHDPVGRINHYYWDFDNDGIFETDGGTSPLMSHVFADRGAYPVSVRVTDDNGLQNVYTRTISVTHPPTADLSASPLAPATGDKVTLNASGSSDPDAPAGSNGIADYRWDLDGDGAFEKDTGTTSQVQTTFATPGKHTVRVQVTDTDGATAAMSLDIVAADRPPAPQLADPGLTIVGQQVTLNASGSSDPDGRIVEYEWDLDDDGTYDADSGLFPTYTTVFDTPGTKTVRVRVTDDDGESDTTTATFKVVSSPVAVLAATPNPARPHQVVSLDATGSSDPDGGLVTFKWDLDGNGTFETDSASAGTETSTWAATGNHTVRVKVTNADGVSAVATRVIAVVNQLPVASITVSGGSVTAGSPATLDASGSADPDGTIVRYEWDLDGNGSFENNTGTTATVTRTYPNPSTIPVKLRVTDNDGGVAVATLSLIVQAPSTAGTGGTGGTGGAGGTGGTSGTGGTGGTGGTAPLGDFSAGLGGSPIQALKLARRKGPTMTCTSDRAIHCTVTATIAAGTAKKLRLARARKPAVVGKAVVDVPAAGEGRFVLTLTKKARKALKRAKRVRLLIKGTAVAADGQSVVLARAILLR